MARLKWVIHDVVRYRLKTGYEVAFQDVPEVSARTRKSAQSPARSRCGAERAGVRNPEQWLGAFDRGVRPKLNQPLSSRCSLTGAGLICQHGRGQRLGCLTAVITKCVNKGGSFMAAE